MIDISFHDAIATVEPPAGRDVAVLMTEDFIPAFDALAERLAGRRFYGAVVPFLIRGRELIDRGLAVLTLPEDHRSFVCAMDGSEAELAGCFTGRGQDGSLLLFVDGLSPAMDGFINRLHRCCGRVPVIGAGVGCKDFVQRPVVFDQHGLAADRALVIGSSLGVHVGARHGWRSLYGPLVVTAAHDNILSELNNQPAFEVYRRALAGLEGVDITPETFLEVAGAYPLGIATFQGDEVIVRDPIAANPDGSLTIVSSVKTMDTLYIMKGESSELIAASGELARESFANLPAHQALLFDCISRALFLGDQYQLAVDGVAAQASASELSVFGVASIGEITNVGHDAIRILNKTTLLGVLDHA